MIRRRFHRITRRASILVAARIVLALVTLVFAAGISISTTTYQAEVGSSVDVTNSLRATDKGFSTATASMPGNGTSCGNPVPFNASPGVANTNITVGDLVYDIQVNSTSSSVPNQPYNVTFMLGSTLFGPLCIRTSASPANGQTIDCKFDIGTNALPTSPYTFRVIIQ